MEIMKSLVQSVGDFCLERFLGRKPAMTSFNELWIPNRAGPAIYAHIHRSLHARVNPGVILVPGGLMGGSVFDRSRGITASDLASLGFTVLHYDPSGRGRTGGEEDYWGLRHQGELATVAEYFAVLPEVEAENISIFSFSIGIGIASGALARHALPFVKCLFDWEGPSNRFNITLNDTHRHLLAMPSSNISFWREREAASAIGEISCGYFRYQAQRDHMQGRFKGHAIELINRATYGKAKWTRMNNNLPGTVFDEARTNEYDWVPPFRNHNGQVLKYFLEVAAQEDY